MIVLGIDPGSRLTAIARVDVRGGFGAPLTTACLSVRMVDSTTSALVHALTSAPQDIVAIEWIEGIAYPVKGPGIVGALIATGVVQGRVAALAEDRKMRVEMRTAGAWRTTLGLGRHPTDAVIATRLARIVAGLPARTNCHVRDAIGVATAVGWALGGDCTGRRTA